MLFDDDNVVLSLFIILFKFSRFNFSSCDSIYSAVFGWVGFPFSEVGGSFGWFI